MCMCVCACVCVCVSIRVYVYVWINKSFRARKVNAKPTARPKTLSTSVLSSPSSTSPRLPGNLILDDQVEAQPRSPVTRNPQREKIEAKPKEPVWNTDLETIRTHWNPNHKQRPSSRRLIHRLGNSRITFSEVVHRRKKGFGKHLSASLIQVRSFAFQVIRFVLSMIEYSPAILST